MLLWWKTARSSISQVFGPEKKQGTGKLWKCLTLCSFPGIDYESTSCLPVELAALHVIMLQFEL